MPPRFFTQQSKDSASHARCGSFQIREWQIKTPVFMPVGTVAAVKGLWNEDLAQMGYRLILANTYHLSLSTGTAVPAAMGGIKKYMAWPYALLTDSGGYQVHSLAKKRRFVEGGVEFQSHIDGSKRIFRPALVLDIQKELASDIHMVLDDCAPAYASQERIRASLDRTHGWAQESLQHFCRQHDGKEQEGPRPKLFGIVQGGLDKKLRSESLDFIQDLLFDGIALGGLSVGEERQDLYEILDFLGPLLDPHRPRYLMGVGAIPDILEAVKNGIDMFDCVLPTRNARNGQAFTSLGVLKIRNSIFKQDTKPLDPNCLCRVCSTLNRSYLRHLFFAGEMLGPMALSYHNLFFYAKFMQDLRSAIQLGHFGSFYKHWLGIFS